MMKNNAVWVANPADPSVGADKEVALAKQHEHIFK